MLTEIRWEKEQQLMRDVFPEFRPFRNGVHFGFEGFLKGARSQRIFQVRLEANQDTYPQVPPRIDMQPRLGMHWIGEGARRRLCLEREWRPARSTFANTLLTLVRYLDEHDRRPGGAPEKSIPLPAEDSPVAAPRHSWFPGGFWRGGAY